jgi:hypothetical protein
MTVASCMRYMECTGDTRWSEEREGSVDGSDKKGWFAGVRNKRFMCKTYPLMVFTNIKVGVSISLYRMALALTEPLLVSSVKERVVSKDPLILASNASTTTV